MESFDVIGDPLGLIGDIEAPLQLFLVRGNANWTRVPITLQGLYASESEEESTRRIDGISPQRKCHRLSSGTDEFSRSEKQQPVAKPLFLEDSMHDGKGREEWHTKVIHETLRNSTRSPFRSIDGHEIRNDISSPHFHDELAQLLWMTQTELDAGGKTSHLLDMSDEVNGGRRVRAFEMMRRRDHILAQRNPAQLGDLRRDLLLRQETTLSRLRPLRELDFDHLHLVLGGNRDEFAVVETPILVAHPEFRGPHLEGEITLFHQVILGIASLPGIHQGSGQFRASGQRTHRIAAKSAITHGADHDGAPKVIGALESPRRADGDFERF